MPRSGRLTILAAECALAPRFPLFANGAQAQAATQTYTGKQVVADSGSVMGTVFLIARNLHDAHRWNQSTHSWTQLSARAPHDDLIRIGAKSFSSNPIHPNTLHPTVETSLLNKTSNSAIYRSADGVSEHCLHYWFMEHLGHLGSRCPMGVDFEQCEVFSAEAYAPDVNEANYFHTPDS